jgi:hypothetical protein
LPADAPTAFRDIFTGRIVEAVGGAGHGRGLPVAALFDELPVSLLIAA